MNIYKALQLLIDELQKPPLSLSKQYACVETRYFLEHLGFSWQDIIINDTLELDSNQISKINDFVTKRRNNFPFAYIVGKKPFWKGVFEVTPDVLIPRSDTELMIEAATIELNKSFSYKFLDLGVGSGCIIVSLLQEFPNATGIAVDISEASLAIAKRNAQNNKVGDRIEFILSNWFEKLEGLKFDAIFCNPPYIAENEISNMAQETLLFEPHLALFAKENGLQYYRKILHQVENFLLPKGKLFFEIGYKQSDEVKKETLDILQKKTINQYKDLQQHPRILVIS